MRTFDVFIVQELSRGIHRLFLWPRPRNILSMRYCTSYINFYPVSHKFWRCRRSLLHYRHLILRHQRICRSHRSNRVLHDIRLSAADVIGLKIVLRLFEFYDERGLRTHMKLFWNRAIDVEVQVLIIRLVKSSGAKEFRLGTWGLRSKRYLRCPCCTNCLTLSCLLRISSSLSSVRPLTD